MARAIALALLAVNTTGCPRREAPLDDTELCAALVPGGMVHPGERLRCQQALALAVAAGCVAEAARLRACVEREAPRDRPEVGGRGRLIEPARRHTSACEPDLEALRACVAPCGRVDLLHAGAEHADAGAPSFAARRRGCVDGCVPGVGTAVGGACTAASVCEEVCCLCPGSRAAFSVRACDGARCQGAEAACARALEGRGREVLCH